MKSTQRSTVVVVFEDRDQANNALDGLLQAGFTRDRIGIAIRHDPPATTTTGEVAEEVASSPAAQGAVTGAVAGLGLGALAGLGVLTGIIPVIGPAIAAGTLGVLVSNAAAGAGVVGLFGALVGAGVPDDEARFYDSEFQAGRLIMTVDAGTRGSEAVAILHAHGAYDIQSRGLTPSGTSTSSRD